MKLFYILFHSQQILVAPWQPWLTPGIRGQRSRQGHLARDYQYCRKMILASKYMFWGSRISFLTKNITFRYMAFSKMAAMSIYASWHHLLIIWDRKLIVMSRGIFCGSILFQMDRHLKLWMYMAWRPFSQNGHHAILNV